MIAVKVSPLTAANPQLSMGKMDAIFFAGPESPCQMWSGAIVRHAFLVFHIGTLDMIGQTRRTNEMLAVTDVS